MSYRLVVTKRVEKQLDAIPDKQRRMILSWMAEHLDGCSNPKAIADGKQVQVQGTCCRWRYRCGSYRILARIEDERLVIEVVRIGHRQGVYHNLPDL